MKDKYKWKKLNLQRYAEGGENPPEDNSGKPEDKPKPEDEKKYSEKDVAAMQAKWKQEQEAAAKSAKAVADDQLVAGLDDDSICGPMTWGELLA